MTAPTIRQLLADEIMHATYKWAAGRWHSTPPPTDLADALLASPELAAIIDIAADRARESELKLYGQGTSPEVRALLDDWQANR